MAKQPRPRLRCWILLQGSIADRILNLFRARSGRQPLARPKLRISTDTVLHKPRLSDQSVSNIPEISGSRWGGKKVKNTRTSDRLELSDCERVLEMTLCRLDRLGAGIAAIHVDAAIQQLRENIRLIEEAEGQFDFDPDLICAFKVQRMIH